MRTRLPHCMAPWKTEKLLQSLFVLALRVNFEMGVISGDSNSVCISAKPSCVIHHFVAVFLGRDDLHQTFS